jgi:transposase
LKYGAIVVDLESGDVLDLRSDRSPEVIAAWLKQRPGIEVVSRDRSNQIREGIDQGAPQAIQVADRFHLLQNLTETIYKVIQPKQKLIKDLFKTAATDHFQDQPISNDEPTAADLRRWDRIEQVHRWHEIGWTAKAIAAEIGIHAKTVRRYLRLTDFQPLTRPKRSQLLDPYKPYLRQRWAEGCHQAVLLYQEIQAQGYLGKRTQLQDFLRSLKVKSPSLDPQHLEMVTTWQQLPLSKLAFAIGRPEATWPDKTWLLSGLKLLHEQDDVLAETIDLARTFTQMISLRVVDQLDPWLKQALTAKATPIRRFAASLMADLSAVRAALQYHWSNGRVEGTINRLKNLKRQMYGRAKLDLLKIRLMGAASP